MAKICAKIRWAARRGELRPLSRQLGWDRPSGVGISPAKNGRSSSRDGQLQCSVDPRKLKSPFASRLTLETGGPANLKFQRCYAALVSTSDRVRRRRHDTRAGNRPYPFDASFVVTMASVRSSSPASVGLLGAGSGFSAGARAAAALVAERKRSEPGSGEIPQRPLGGTTTP